jgi:tyrosine-specific transport protein
MLGLPVLSAAAGFWPSTLIFVLCWLFMVATGLLLLEVNHWFGKEINIVTMAEKTLGPTGKAVGWFVFLFLFYSLMVAYMAASGSLVVDFLERLFYIRLPESVGSFLFCILFGAVIYRGTHAVDRCNRILMLGLIATYLSLVLLGAQYVDHSLLKRHHWSATFLVIPAVVVSFGYHNLIPSLHTYFKGDLITLKRAILIGSAIPLLVYILWEWLILGLVPIQDFEQAFNRGEIATEALEKAVGSSFVVNIAEAFAFFAIITSFLSVALSFVDFLSDALKIPKHRHGKLVLEGLALLPALICAILYPTAFLTALHYAGGFGAVTLFGILPVCMVWKGRYHELRKGPILLGGGKPVLILILICSIAIMLLTYMTL